MLSTLEGILLIGMLLTGMLLTGMLLTGMLLTEVAGMLEKLFSVLLASLSMLLLFGGMLSASVSAAEKLSKCSIHASRIHKALFANKKQLGPALQRGQDRRQCVSYL
jgi:hypothetical protein